jgi:hypothetical protein
VDEQQIAGRDTQTFELPHKASRTDFLGGFNHLLRVPDPVFFEIPLQFLPKKCSPQLDKNLLCGSPGVGMRSGVAR